MGKHGTCTIKFTTCAECNKTVTYSRRTGMAYVDSPPRQRKPKRCDGCSRLARRGPRDDYRSKSGQPCVTCGAASRLKYCSNACRMEKRKRDNGVMPRLKIAVRSHAVDCVFCGNESSTMDSRIINASSDNWICNGCFVDCLIVKTCGTCGELYQGKQRQKHAECDDCRKEKSREASRACSNMRYIPRAATERKCSCCNAIFKSKGSTKYCSQECRVAVVRHNRNNRKGKKRAAAINVPYEPINRKKVFARDKYRCRRCGKKVQAKQPYKTNAAQVDHVIPWAQMRRLNTGHVYSNVQTLCRVCNSRKKDALEYLF